ncbi:MAG TPA: dephospho-CoA kinase [Planctomycetota bacterium]|nr:dephospho-CoA kinase [Planctomycetota bacterium]
MMNDEKIVIGLVGQICAGKSSVAEAFRRHGARVYDADKSVHEIYARPDVIAEVRAMFGNDVIDENGQIDRKILGEIVFSDEAKLRRLTEEIVFPRTGIEMQKAIEVFRKSDAPALVLDAPTLFEAGRAGLCDNIMYVTAPSERREAWARKRGWPPGELARREAMFRGDEGKRKRADAVIENAGTLDDLDRQAGRLMRLWTMQP